MLVEIDADQFHVPGLRIAQNIARSALIEIGAGDRETGAELIEGFERAQTLLARLRNRLLRCGQDHLPAPSPPPHASAQLMQLRKAEPIRSPDDHRIGPRHVEPGLDDVGRKQNVPITGREPDHRLVQFATGHLAVHLDDGEIGRDRLDPLSHGVQIGDARYDDEALPLAHLFPAQCKADRRIVDRADRGADRLATGGRRGDHGYLLQADHRPVQRARNGRRAHHQEMDVGGLSQFRLVGCTEALFLVDYDKAELGIFDRLPDDRCGADDHADRSVRQTRHD